VASVLSSSKAPVLVAGAFLLALFAIPFLFGNLEVRAENREYGLKAMYAQGVLWDECEEVFRLTAVPPEKVIARRVEQVLLFPWHHGQPPFRGPFSAEWTGWIYIPEDGNYKFATFSDDGSSVYIDGRLLVENWGLHMRRRHHKDIRLKKGVHPIAIRYYNLEFKATMYFLWARPGQHLQSVAKEYLFPERPDAPDDSAS
jgi:hypothetical protein